MQKDGAYGHGFRQEKTQNTTPPREQNKAKKTVYKVSGEKKGWRKGGIIRENNALGAKRTESFKKKELSMYANIVEKLGKRARRNLVQSFNPRARGDWGREGMQSPLLMGLKKGESTEQINVSVKLRRRGECHRKFNKVGKNQDIQSPNENDWEESQQAEEGEVTRPPGKDGTDLDRDKNMGGLMMRGL